MGAAVATFWHANLASLVADDGLSNVAADKAAAVAGGWLPGLSPRLRWRYRAAPRDRVAKIAAEARGAFPEWFGYLKPLTSEEANAIHAILPARPPRLN